MFDAALGRNGFRAEAKNTNTWNTKTWIETNHNLDRIITRDDVAYGVEIKNTQNYISRHELLIKIRLCQYLNVKPLFIMRFAPNLTWLKSTKTAASVCCSRNKFILGATLPF